MCELVIDRKRKLGQNEIPLSRGCSPDMWTGFVMVMVSHLWHLVAQNMCRDEKCRESVSSKVVVERAQARDNGLQWLGQIL